MHRAYAWVLECVNTFLSTLILQQRQKSLFSIVILVFSTLILISQYHDTHLAVSGTNIRYQPKKYQYHDTIHEKYQYQVFEYQYYISIRF